MTGGDQLKNLGNIAKNGKEMDEGTSSYNGPMTDDKPNSQDVEDIIIIE